MRRSAIAVIGACALSPAAAQDFTFPQLDFVVANNQRLLDLTGFAPQRDFASYTFTVEWQNPLMNGAQSSQARFGLSTNFGATLINDAGSLVSPTFGASNTSMPTTLVFTGDFLGPSSPGFYNPFTDTVTPSMPALIDVSTGFFDIVAFQTQSGTSASWLATLTLHEPEPPETDPEDLGIVDVGYEGAVPVNGFRDFTQEQIEEGQTLFYTFTHPGGPITIDTDGSFFFIFDNPDDTILYLFDTAGDLIALNDDRGLDDFLSEIRLPDLPAGDYAVAVTGFPSSASGSDFVIDNSSESVGDVVVNVTLPRQPTAFTDLGVVAEAGQLVSLDTCGSDFDTELGLWDCKGTLIAENDDSISDPADLCGGLRQSSIGDRALDAGTYFAAVSGFLTNHFAGFEAIVEF
ncbi:MAG: DVUA0089 family protein, partial [Planctomycetota bacterium]